MRRALQRVLLVALLAGCAPLGKHTSMAHFEIENPAPGVYVHYGAQAEMTTANGGDVANVGFVIGERCVAVIDTGGTYAVGRSLRDAIRRITDLPICYVINTHVHPDHIFGNQAFVGDGPEFVGHARLVEAMRRRGANYLTALKRDLGAVAEGTTLVFPARGVQGVERLDLGNRMLRLRAWKTAHTDTDLTVFDETSATFWLGDLGFVGHIPVVDGNLRGFIAAVEELTTVQSRLAIPGHGRISVWPDAIRPEQLYLERLLADVRAALAARKTLAESIETIGYDRRQGWLLADQFHKRNVSAAYAELEWDE